MRSCGVMRSERLRPPIRPIARITSLIVASSKVLAFTEHSLAVTLAKRNVDNREALR